MLKGSNCIIIDLETAKSAHDCLCCGHPEESHSPLMSNCKGYEAIGWERKTELGLSIACYYDYADQCLHWFDRATLETTMMTLVQAAPLMVGFNSRQFDFPLMRGLLRREADGLAPENAGGTWAVRQGHLRDLCDRFKALCATSYDILAEIWKADPSRKFERGLNSLDAISQANGYGAKEMTGAEAPRLWAAGRYAEVINYCAGDVSKTRLIFEQIVCTGEIVRGDGQRLTLAAPGLPS